MNDRQNSETLHESERMGLLDIDGIGSFRVLDIISDHNNDIRYMVMRDVNYNYYRLTVKSDDVCEIAQMTIDSTVTLPTKDVEYRDLTAIAAGRKNRAK